MEWCPTRMFKKTGAASGAFQLRFQWLQSVGGDAAYGAIFSPPARDLSFHDFIAALLTLTLRLIGLNYVLSEFDFWTLALRRQIKSMGNYRAVTLVERSTCTRLALCPFAVIGNAFKKSNFHHTTQSVIGDRLWPGNEAAVLEKQPHKFDLLACQLNVLRKTDYRDKKPLIRCDDWSNQQNELPPPNKVFKEKGPQYAYKRKRPPSNRRWSCRLRRHLWPPLRWRTFHVRVVAPLTLTLGY